ncbi:MAG: ATP phosphoribosyltransferase [Fibrobacterota bacterium]|nr:ATP phosphoribosyltransferase [Fibrobacterota bacterium]QQS05743.1 MAG: ATP phosphoribosyltransferase [Fibrobacterota bacterium]
MIQIGIPSKGRLHEPIVALLKQSGYRFRVDGRSLRIPAGSDTSLVLLRTDDISTLVAAGILDAGISTQDIVEETSAQVVEVLKLDMGHCRIVVAVPENGEIQTPADLDGKTIATSFPKLAENFFQKHGATPRFVEVGGSCEAMVPLGLAQGIVDITETGSSLRDNGLKILSEIGSYQTVLVARPERAEDPEIKQLARRLKGAMIAQTYRLVEYNVPRAKLAEAEKITPGFQAPTVNSLEDPAWCAVRALVPVKQLGQVIDSLEALGATAILQFGIENCRL